MDMTPSYDVVPGVSVGPFVLGDSLWHVLDVLRAQKGQYPKVDVSYDAEDPVKTSTTVHLGAVALLFTHPSQKLEHIRVSLSGTPVELSYDTHVLAFSRQPLSRAQVGRLLGPTYAPAEGKVSYPGITFDIPSTGAGGREDPVAYVSVHSKEGEGKSGDKAIIEPGKGMTIIIGDEEIRVELGKTTSQDLLLDLGPPLRKFYKEDSRISRIWAKESRSATGESYGCFWNYFQLGLDFLVSESGVVDKIIAHSNIPGSAEFQRYARCPWSIAIDNATLDFTSPLSDFQEHLGSEEPGEGGTPTVNSKEREGEAMILDRTVEGGLDGVTGVGSSRLMGFDGLIVEEDQASGGIASVLIYKS